MLQDIPMGPLLSWVVRYLQSRNRTSVSMFDTPVSQELEGDVPG